MRVVQLLTQSVGGPVDHAVDVAGELARQGHESHLIGPVDRAGPTGSRLRRDGVTLHEVACTSLRDVHGARRVAEVVRGLSPDVVHCQDRRAGLVGRGVASRAGLPTVYTLHGVPDSFSHLVAGNLRAADPAPAVRVLNQVAEGLLARTPRSALVTPCEAVADYARRHLRVPEGRVHAVHNGVGPSWLGHEPDPTSEIGGLHVVWLGVLAPVKRVPQLVEAVAAVPGCRLTLIGDGPERGRVEAAVRAAGADSRVELRGFDPDPAPTLATADVLVLPSAAEACPMAVLQGMALGLPVVASRVGGVAEVVRDGIDGLLVDAGDDEALREALVLLRDQSELRHCMGVSAARRIREDFTLERCTDALVRVYREVAA